MRAGRARWMWIGAGMLLLAACSPPAVSPVSGPVQGSYQGGPDQHPWDSAPNAWSHSTWKQGDRGSWEGALRQRAQNENEYQRTN